METQQNEQPVAGRLVQVAGDFICAMNDEKAPIREHPRYLEMEGAWRAAASGYGNYGQHEERRSPAAPGSLDQRGGASQPIAQHAVKVLVSVAERMSTGEDFRVFEDIAELIETLTVEMVSRGADPENSVLSEPASDK